MYEMPLKIYISRSHNVSDGYFAAATSYLKSVFKNCDIYFWNRGTAYGHREQCLIDDCDLFILLINRSNIIGKGSYDETVRRIHVSKLNAGLYQRITDDSFQFYDFDLRQINDGSFQNYAKFQFGSNISDTVIAKFKDYTRKKKDIQSVKKEELSRKLLLLS